MIYNLKRECAEIIKVLDLDIQITALNYGPYDNGHVLLGLNNGQLVAFDFLTLERLEKTQIFDGKEITAITFDPTNYIFVSGERGKMVALTYVDRKMHYLYLDLGKSKFCTL